MSLPTLLLTKLGRKYAHKAYIYFEDSGKAVEKVLDNLYNEFGNKTIEDIVLYYNTTAPSGSDKLRKY